MTQTGGKKKTKRRTTKRRTTTRRPKRRTTKRRTTKRRTTKRRTTKRKTKRRAPRRRRAQRGGSHGETGELKPKFIRSPLMDTHLVDQLDPLHDVNAYLSNYYMQSDIDALSKKIYGAAVDSVYNRPATLSARIPL